MEGLLPRVPQVVPTRDNATKMVALDVLGKKKTCLIIRKTYKTGYEKDCYEGTYKWEIKREDHI